MSEVIEGVGVQSSPLDETHGRLGASFAKRGGLTLPVSYGDPAAEYRAVREGGAGLIDLSSRGRIRVGGREAVQFLNGLITNDVKALEENAWMEAAFPNVQGRLQASVRVINHAGRFLFDTEAVTHERVLKLLERFTLAGDFHVTDITSETALITVQGARSGDVVGAVLGAVAARLESGRIAIESWRGGDTVTVMRATHTGEDGFDLICNAREAPALWDSLVAAGARAVGFDALEVLRIEAGLPRYGVDMDETNVVLETGLDSAVSFTKGCYIGQEIIARIRWRGHVAKKIAGLRFDEKREIQSGSKVRAIDGKEIGRVTSPAFSPRLNRTIALAYVKYDYLAAGTQVKVISGDEEIEAQVAELPFVRGSWFAPQDGAGQKA